MSQEKVREILSHVDMTKIDLSSFKISEKKFNEIAILYRNRLLLSCVGIILEKEKCSEDEVKGAFDLMRDLVENPTKYEYASVYADARRTTDKVIDDMLLNRDKTVNDIKVKSIEKCVKSKYKSIRESIEKCLEAGITFEDEMNEELVERCFAIAKRAIDDVFKKATGNVETPTEEHIPEPEPESEPELEPTSESEPKIEETVTAENKQPEKQAKPPFWKRMFVRS